MGQTAPLLILLAGIFAFFAPPLQRALQSAFQTRRALIFAAPLILTAFFLAVTFNPTLTLLVLAYTLAPTLALYFLGLHGDFLAVLLLWLPIEFGLGASLVPRAQQGFVHTVAYGIAILLGLTLFLAFRRLEGMRYKLPRSARDFLFPAIAFLILAPILIAIGIPIGFIPPPHLPAQPASRMAAAVATIFAGIALPEEILFRALIQNLLMQRYGENARTLFIASLIFGAAHLDNGPQPLPNWRYMILATIAGFAYGRVFQKCNSVVSSALLHTAIDWTKHFFF